MDAYRMPGFTGIVYIFAQSVDKIVLFTGALCQNEHRLFRVNQTSSIE